jgi:hypothetical protein
MPPTPSIQSIKSMLTKKSLPSELALGNQQHQRDSEVIACELNPIPSDSNPSSIEFQVSRTDSKLTPFPSRLYEAENNLHSAIVNHQSSINPSQTGAHSIEIAANTKKRSDAGLTLMLNHLQQNTMRVHAGPMRSQAGFIRFQASPMWANAVLIRVDANPSEPVPVSKKKRQSCPEIIQALLRTGKIFP